MNTLQTELRRLYGSGDFNTANAIQEGGYLVAPDGRVRAMVLELARPADWNTLSTVWQGVQAELGLPAPAIAVSGADGYQLWFSVAEPVSSAQAGGFLESIRRRYLQEIAPGRIGMMPSANRNTPCIPALQPDTGLWSAFVAPGLASLFSNAPWLDVCPSPEAQATLLSRLECIKPAAFQAVLDGDGSHDDVQPDSADPLSMGGPISGAQSLNPKQFLLHVMRDPTVAMPLRIEAAKALLPYS